MFKTASSYQWTKREIVQIGRNYSVPDERLYPKLVDLAKQVYDKFSTNETDALIVAQLLGHASIGGAFNGKVATLSSYGLVERRQGKIRLTEIGRRAVAPKNGKEKVDGVKSALFNLNLWKRLYHDYTAKGAELPSNFSVDLARIADIPPDDAKSKAEWVAKAFNSDVSYLRSIERESSAPGSQLLEARAKTSDTGTRTQTPSAGSAMKSQAASLPSVSSGQIVFLSPVDHIELTVPRSARHMPMLKAFIGNALKAIDEELAAEAKVGTERGKTKKGLEKG